MSGFVTGLTAGAVSGLASGWGDGARAVLARCTTVLASVAALLDRHARVARVNPQATHIAPRKFIAPRQLTLADQWFKITAVLIRSVEGASAVQHMQSAATQQLDLAQYGLSTLVDELSAVMTMPGQLGNRRNRTATLHVFGTGSDAAGAVAHNRALAA